MNILLDTHTHTIASGHAYNSMLEMVDAASKRGLKILGITEHAPKMPGTCHEFYFQNLKAVNREVIMEKYGIELILGAELNIIDYKGTVDLPVSTIKKLDVTIASMHSPCLKPGGRAENTAGVIGAIENPYIDIIGHPDDGRFPLEYEPIVKAAKENGKLLEVNNSSLNPNGFRLNAKENYKEMLSYCIKYEQPIVIDSDAHFMDAIGNFPFVERLLEELNFPENLIVNQSVEQFKKYIQKYKEK